MSLVHLVEPMVQPDSHRRKKMSVLSPIPCFLAVIVHGQDLMCWFPNHRKYKTKLGTQRIRKVDLRLHYRATTLSLVFLFFICTVIAIPPRCSFLDGAIIPVYHLQQTDTTSLADVEKERVSHFLFQDGHRQFCVRAGRWQIHAHFRHTCQGCRVPPPRCSGAHANNQQHNTKIPGHRFTGAPPSRV